MITEDTKQQLVRIAVDFFKSCQDDIKDKISYELLDKLFSNKVYKSEIETAGVLLAATALVHNIPRKNTKLDIWELRPCEECYIGLGTFVKANRLEKFCIEFSKDKSNIDLKTMSSLPTLEFLNNNNEYLVAGFGEGVPDLIDPLTGTTYEVKANYEKRGSVSGFHTAKRLIDCLGTHINVYHILYDNSVDFGNAIYRFPNVIPNELITFSHAISEDLLELIKSGELIPLVEDLYKTEGLVWNP